MLLALEKVAGGEEQRKVLQGELTDLQSQLREVEAQLEERERLIQACQQRYNMFGLMDFLFTVFFLRYKSASQEWSEAKKTITSKAETLESLKSTVAEKMDQVIRNIAPQQKQHTTYANICRYLLCTLLLWRHYHQSVRTMFWR